MSYRANDTLTLVMLILVGGFLVFIGFASRWPGFMEEFWWGPLGLGVLIILLCLISIGFVATQPAKLPCPYCQEKILPKVSMGSGHLKLSRLDED